ncbi:zinc-dependent hydrolase YcbL [Syntrophotalea carbinolica DSM 2380]|uniref:Zinc-dependent hydrolase YcbL n=1 Tax=Syntrophotalea carbinolica (strain DSM 2380 / NBRC 103641 / GraBd1) TaxID=338963 RepID=Q3A304_SYNC1|nr:MBL fold metallo-hydrolase [Syntrophotalea carbinolica]ABA89253.1 zinc-dependent hydrolase YcbL [Syntrophotalea carbinolica DSM 2380]
MTDLWQAHMVTGELGVNCYLLGCPKTRQAVVIDPGGNGSSILAELEKQGFELKAVINTHGHFDHIGGNKTLIDQTGADLLLHAEALPLLRGASSHAASFGCRAIDPSPEPTRLLQDGDRIEVGSIVLEVLHVPGHSPGSVCLKCGEALFAGDVLFAGSIGRTDLPGGDHHLLLKGLQSRVLTLADSVKVYPGHGPATTIGHERKNNPYLNYFD